MGLASALSRMRPRARDHESDPRRLLALKFGDIDSVAIAPTGIAFAIETKTRTFDDRHVARVQEMADWLRTRRRRWCPQGALAVLCVVHARRLERVEAGVLIVSLDRLLEALRTAAGARERPRSLAGLAPSQPKRI